MEKKNENKQELHLSVGLMAESVFEAVQGLAAKNYYNENEEGFEYETQCVFFSNTLREIFGLVSNWLLLQREIFEIEESQK